MRLNATRLGSIASSRSFGDQLDDLAGQVPNLDLNFAQNKSLIDDYSGATLVTFTRASSGTFVGSDGLIRTAVTNLLLRSEEFNDTAWAKTSTTITANSEIAPNGTLTADTLTDTNSTGDAFTRQTVTSPVSGGTYTVSVYLKQGNTATTRVSIDYTGATAVNQDATVTWSTNTTSFGALQNVGGGWYRLSFSKANNTSGNTNVLVTIRASGDTSGVETGFVYAWGAQLEQSSSVGEYIPTTSTINSAPRFDHNPTTGESLGLLVEEQRTNLLLYSACDSNWTTAGFGTATYNLGLSALGIFSGVSVGSLGQVWHTLYRSGISLTASTVYAFTLFYRAGTSGRCRLVIRNNTTATETIINGAAGNLSVNGAFAGSATVLSQYLCSDGLTYVITGTFTPNGTSTDHWFRIGPDSATSGQTVIALGAQLEAGSFPTSYISTTTATVTRSADVASITGTNFSSFYNQTEGTVFADASTQQSAAGHVLAGVSTGSFGSSAYLAKENTNFLVAAPGSAPSNLSIQLSTVSSNVGLRAVLAFTAGTGSASAVMNGGTVGTDASTGIPITMSQMAIGSSPWSIGTNLWNGTIKRITYWPVRLANPTLQAITTP